MKKSIGIFCSFIFLLMGAYSFWVIFFNTVLKSNVTPSPIGVVAIVFVTACAICCGVLILYSCRHSRIRRFNADIFTTICLFFTFMFSFLLPGNLLTAFGTLESSVGFFALHDTVKYISAAGMGIYEAFFFLSMLAMGLTIGEDVPKSED